jgi:hypothetical protein
MIYGDLSRSIVEQHYEYVTHLLQLEELKSSPAMQTPFHLSGTGPKPVSSKLGDSGQMPESRRPMMVSVVGDDDAAGLAE